MLSVVFKNNLDITQCWIIRSSQCENHLSLGFASCDKEEEIDIISTILYTGVWIPKLLYGCEINGY